MKYYVYIIQSQKDLSYYIGYSSNLESRLDYHNSGRQRYTRNKIPYKLVHSEEFDNKTEALKREKQIKSFKGGEAFKKLIGGV